MFWFDRELLSGSFMRAQAFRRWGSSPSP